MDATQPLTIDCPAKINLALSVGSPRNDGMHPIASWMVAVDLADRLTLWPGESTQFDLAFDPQAPVPQAVDWPLEKDLAYRAHKLLEEEVDRPLPVGVRLSKQIPAGAGLGGGSGNAAGLLVGVNRLMGLGLSEGVLARLGQKLGSDVGFLIAALMGRPSALVTGLGERIESAPLPGPIHMVLIFPPFGCPTGPVYRAFDQLHPAAVGSRDADEPAVRRLMAQNPLTPDGPFNDLAQSACVVRPELSGLVEKVHQACGLPVHVTGSGSTLFVVASSDPAAATAARKIASLTGLAARPTRTL